MMCFILLIKQYNMKQKIIKKAFTEEFIKDAGIIFDLLENLKENPDEYYEKDTYGDGMILSHEIDLELNKPELSKIVKDWDSLSELHAEIFDFPLIKDGKIDIGIFDDVYSDISFTNGHIHYDTDHNVYYDPSIHDKSDWRD